MLDNAVFLPGCLVNQRGQTEYTGYGYGIDRWKIQDTATGNLIVKDGYTEVSITGLYGSLMQVFDKEAIIEGTYTLSVLTTYGLHAWTFNASKNTPASAPIGWLGIPNVYSYFNYNDDGTSKLHLLDNASSDTISVSVIAAKLELGTQQTLAHQDSSGKWVLNELPNYADTLARCQRYLFVSGSIYINCEGQVPYLAVPYFLPKMRTIPSCTVYSAPGSEQLGVAKRTTNYLSGQQIDSTGDVWVNTASIGSSGGTLLASEKGFDPNQYVFKIVANAEL